ncbi:protein kinase C epsilon type [Ictalurus punctatus]|uniref:Protein kinase C epsilon type n=1 Tax=Ictalurus punctatus TaxID=7998 RepID=A0A979FC48_ICTPU|nr:protein kinase C epsilon type [Ictalurus punctatus]
MGNSTSFFRPLRLKKKNKVKLGVEEGAHAVGVESLWRWKTLKHLEEDLSESGMCDGDITSPLDHMERELNEGHSEESRQNEELQPEGKSLEDFNLLSLLGRGGYGKVFLSELRGTDELYALKIIKKDRILADNTIDNTLMERRILVLASKNPYLTHLFSCFQTTHYLCFAMEYVNEGNLSHHIPCPGGFDEPRSQFYAAEISCALMFLHRNEIVHRDVKPENILLDADGHCKLADFGICKEVLQDVKMTFCGSENYVAPEMIQGQKCSTSVDWWALGVLMYEMLTGCRPFDDEDWLKLCESIIEDEPEYPLSLSKNAVSILKAFLKKDPKTRLGCEKSRFRRKEEAIRVHPFFKTINWVLLEQKKITPPFKPLITTKTDVTNFKEEFTREELTLSLVNNAIIEDFSQKEFQGFSYINAME